MLESYSAGLRGAPSQAQPEPIVIAMAHYQLRAVPNPRIRVADICDALTQACLIMHLDFLDLYVLSFLGS